MGHLRSRAVNSVCAHGDFGKRSAAWGSPSSGARPAVPSGARQPQLCPMLRSSPARGAAGLGPGTRKAGALHKIGLKQSQGGICHFK